MPKRDSFEFKDEFGNNPFDFPTFGGESDRYIPTRESKLLKFIRFINRPNSAKNDLLIGLAKGQDAKTIIKNMRESFSGKRETSGSDVVASVVGKQKKGAKLPEKFARGASGFALDVFTDPLNLLAIGPLTKAGQAVKMGKSGLKTSVGVASGLAKGERAVASFAGVQTPEIINKAIGARMQAVGQVLDTLPVIGNIKKSWGKTFDYLNPVRRKQLAQREDILSAASKSVNEIGGMIEKAQKEFSLDSLEEPLKNYYKSKGYTKEQAFNELVTDAIEKPIYDKQAGKLDEIIGEIEKNGGAVPQEVRASIKSVIEGVPVSSAAPKAVKEVADKIRPIYEGMAGAEVSRGLLDAGQVVEGYQKRMLSKEVSAREVEMGKRQGANLSSWLKGLSEARSRKFGALSTRQVNAMYEDPVVRGAMWKGLGEDAVQAQMTTAEALKNLFSKTPGVTTKAATFFETNPITALSARLASHAQAVSSADAIRNVVDNPSFASLKPAGFENETIVKIPDAFQEAVGAKSVYMPGDVAEEFVKVTESLTNPKTLNELAKSYDEVLGLWKVVTMFGGPHVYLPTAIRNLLGGHTLSIHAGAASPKNMAKAMPIAWLYKDRKKLVSNGTWDAALKATADKVGVSPETIRFLDNSRVLNEGITNEVLDYGRSAADSLGQKAAKIPVLVREGVQLNELGDNYNRIQHFLTRLDQGYTPAAALDDTRRVQYDYLLGLTDFEKSVAKRAIPFYAWMRFNIPAMVENAIAHPGQLSKLKSGLNDVEATLGNPEDGTPVSKDVWPEYIKSELHARIGFGADGKWRAFRLRSFLPVADLESVASAKNFVDTLVGSLSPVAKLPYELSTGRSTFFKSPGGDEAPITRFPGEQGSVLGLPVSKAFESAIKQIARPINVADKLLDAKYSTSDKFAMITAMKSQPIDVEQAMKNAKRTYDQQASKLNTALKYAKNQNQADKIMEEIAALQARSRVAE